MNCCANKIEFNCHRDEIVGFDGTRERPFSRLSCGDNIASFDTDTNPPTDALKEISEINSCTITDNWYDSLTGRAGRVIVENGSVIENFELQWESGEDYCNFLIENNFVEDIGWAETCIVFGNKRVFHFEDGSVFLEDRNGNTSLRNASGTFFGITRRTETKLLLDYKDGDLCMFDILASEKVPTGMTFEEAAEVYANSMNAADGDVCVRIMQTEKKFIGEPISRGSSAEDYAKQGSIDFFFNPRYDDKEHSYDDFMEDPEGYIKSNTVLENFNGYSSEELAEIVESYKDGFIASAMEYMSRH